jgi:hypothetical protein
VSGRRRWLSRCRRCVSGRRRCTFGGERRSIRRKSRKRDETQRHHGHNGQCRSQTLEQPSSSCTTNSDKLSQGDRLAVFGNDADVLFHISQLVPPLHQ